VRRFSLLLLFLSLLSGCTSVYYQALEHNGIDKRDLLIERIDKVHNAQVAASEQFKRTLLTYRSVVLFQGSAVSERERQLRADLHASQLCARSVRYHLDGVAAVARDFFREWKKEIAQYKDVDAQRRAQASFQRTHDDYEVLYTELEETEARMGPALELLSDQILELEHRTKANSDARALAKVEQRFDTLIAQIKRTNEHADQLVGRLRDGRKPDTPF
jgi:hypothetical protein